MSLTSIRPSFLKNFVRKVQTVDFFTLAKTTTIKYTRRNAQMQRRRSGTPFDRQKTREMAYRNLFSSSEE
jgi:hypothetical protein